MEVTAEEAQQLEGGGAEGEGTTVGDAMAVRENVTSDRKLRAQKPSDDDQNMVSCIALIFRLAIS